jgi:peptidoglycan/LPS O-acetylase OafA/YrhL
MTRGILEPWEPCGPCSLGCRPRNDGASRSQREHRRMAETDPLLKGNDGAQRPARKVRFIQGFRALAIAWIVITHYTYIGDEFWSRFGQRTPLALFTVLSGYLTHQIYSRREDAEGLWEFYWRRFAKLGVMYYSTELLVAVFLSLTLIVNAAGSADVLTAAARFCLDVLMLNVWLTPVALFIPEDEATASEGGPFVAFIRNGMPEADCRSWLYPINGPLWYVQALLFCWFTYPLLGHYFKTEKGSSRVVTILAMILLGVLAVVPALIPFFVEVSWQYDTFLHNFPMFFLPVFYVGVAASELALQESWDESSDIWMRFKARYSTLVGELLFVLLTFVNFLLVPYPVRLHNVMWCTAYAIIIFLLSIGDAAENYTIGLRFLLESDVAQALGDASFCIFALQEPIAILFYWLFGKEGIHAQVKVPERCSSCRDHMKCSPLGLHQSSSAMITILLSL